MNPRPHSPRSVSAVLLVLVLSGLGCQPERYFGPYRLQVPTDLGERSAARTIHLPLDEADQRERADLERCLQNEPDRAVPCRCDYPVLTVNELTLRLDHRLRHVDGDGVVAFAWIGQSVAADAVAPDVVPDLPRIELFGLHRYLLLPASAVEDGFGEDELYQATVAFARDRFSDCESDERDLPAPLEWVVGLSLQEERPASLSFEATLRVRAGR